MPTDGTSSLRFLLWNDPTATAPANQVGLTQTGTGINVSNGLFMVTLNGGGEFGPSAFDGEARWSEVDVCIDATCTSLTILSPRQPVTVAPYAAYSGFADAPWQTTLGLGADLSYTAGDVGIGAGSPTAALHVKPEPIPPGGMMALEWTTRAYLTFFP